MIHDTDNSPSRKPTEQPATEPSPVYPHYVYTRQKPAIAKPALLRMCTTLAMLVTLVVCLVSAIDSGHTHWGRLGLLGCFLAFGAIMLFCVIPPPRDE